MKQRRKKKDEYGYEDWDHGEIITMNAKNPLMVACCHCRLTHEFRFKIIDGNSLEIKILRDDKETKKLRGE